MKKRGKEGTFHPRSRKTAFDFCCQNPRWTTTVSWVGRGRERWWRLGCKRRCSVGIWTSVYHAGDFSCGIFFGTLICGTSCVSLPKEGNKLGEHLSFCQYVSCGGWRQSCGGEPYFVEDVYTYKRIGWSSWSLLVPSGRLMHIDRRPIPPPPASIAQFSALSDYVKSINIGIGTSRTYEKSSCPYTFVCWWFPHFRCERECEVFFRSW